MKLVHLGMGMVAAGCLLAMPAFAQSTSATPAQPAQTVQKQHADGADNPSNPREYQGAAQWHKQHTQSMSHADGSPAGVARQNE